MSISSQPARLKLEFGRHFAAPDGALLSIDGEGLDVTEPWFGQFMCTVGDNDVGFQFGPNGTAENAIAPWVGVGAPETYSLSGGTLHLAYGTGFDEAHEQDMSGREADPELWIAFWGPPVELVGR